LNWAVNKVTARVINNFDFDPNIKYLYYPANYWPHKNHLFLLDIISKLITKTSNIKLILTGKDQNNYKKIIQSKVKELGIDTNVIDLGYVSAGEQNYLYSNIDILVFPTLLGPTNLPPYEAARFGKVSVISNVHEKESYDLETFLVVKDFELNNWIENIMNALRLGSKFGKLELKINNEPMDNINNAIKKLNMRAR
jgi:glycosyltransferase involved in cell wall biosynthesis